MTMSPVIGPSQPVTSVKPEPRPFVPLTPEPVEPRPASSGEVAKPTSVKLAKKLPEVAPDIRPDESQITILSVDDTEGLASKVNTWVRLSGEGVTTSVDGQWAFAGDEPVVAQLRNGQFEIVSNKSVEILGWLADEKTLIVAEEYDISYPEPGSLKPVDEVGDPEGGETASPEKEDVDESSQSD